MYTPSNKVNEPPILYDTINSYYADIAHMALVERGIHFKSQYIKLTNLEQLEPWFIRINPNGQIPSLQTIDKKVTLTDVDVLEEKDDLFDGFTFKGGTMGHGCLRYALFSFFDTGTYIADGVRTDVALGDEGCHLY